MSMTLFRETDPQKKMKSSHPVHLRAYRREREVTVRFLRKEGGGIGTRRIFKPL